MANQEQLGRLLASNIDRNGCQAWNQWRRQYPNDVDLRDATLTGTDLTRADLTRVDLSRACLAFANLTGADLSHANLAFTNLESAHLADANLRGANLTGADLSGAKLERANLQACEMHGVYFRNPAQGEPMWPEMEASAWAALQDEARSSATPPERLVELMTYWPGYQVRHLLVAHPNLPRDELLRNVGLFPVAFLSNPVLPL